MSVNLYIIICSTGSSSIILCYFLPRVFLIQLTIQSQIMNLLPEIPGQWALITSVTVHVSEPTYQAVSRMHHPYNPSFFHALKIWFKCIKLGVHNFISLLLFFTKHKHGISQKPTWYNNLTNTRALTMTKSLGKLTGWRGLTKLEGGCRGAMPPNWNLKNTNFVDITILYITWFTLQPKSANEIGW